MVVPRDSTNNPYRPSSGVCVKKRHGYRCSRGSDYKPVAVARYINLARKLCLSRSLSFSGRLLLHSFSLRSWLVCADYKKLVCASWLHAPAFISGHPFFLFSLSSFTPRVRKCLQRRNECSYVSSWNGTSGPLVILLRTEERVIYSLRMAWKERIMFIECFRNILRSEQPA